MKNKAEALVKPYNLHLTTSNKDLRPLSATWVFIRGVFEQAVVTFACRNSEEIDCTDAVTSSPPSAQAHPCRRSSGQSVPTHGSSRPIE